MNKNKNRPRPYQGIFHKSEALKAALEEFEAIVEKYENLNDTNIWNEITDKLEAVKSKYELCLKILQETKPSEIANRETKLSSKKSNHPAE